MALSSFSGAVVAMACGFPRSSSIHHPPFLSLKKLFAIFDAAERYGFYCRSGSRCCLRCSGALPCRWCFVGSSVFSPLVLSVVTRRRFAPSVGLSRWSAAGVGNACRGSRCCFGRREAACAFPAGVGRVRSTVCRRRFTDSCRGCASPPSWSCCPCRASCSSVLRFVACVIARVG